MDDTLVKLRILASAETNLARIRLRRLANRSALYAIAVGLILLAVVMVNIGAYQLLSHGYGDSVAAFLIAAGNGVLAVILIFAAGRIRSGPEEQMAYEIREMALTELTTDFNDVKGEFDKLGKDVKRIRTGFSILTKGGSIGAGLAGLAPLITTIIEAIRHRKERKADTASE